MKRKTRSAKQLRQQESNRKSNAIVLQKTRQSRRLKGQDPESEARSQVTPRNQKRKIRSDDVAQPQAKRLQTDSAPTKKTQNQKKETIQMWSSSSPGRGTFNFFKFHPHRRREATEKGG